MSRGSKFILFVALDRVLTCCYEGSCWHRHWHGNVIGDILECAHNATLAHPSIGVTSVFAGNAVIS
jgi:hypothetical protein